VVDGASVYEFNPLLTAVYGLEIQREQSQDTQSSILARIIEYWSHSLVKEDVEYRIGMVEFRLKE
jgi:hypothetical protein